MCLSIDGGSVLKSEGYTPVCVDCSVVQEAKKVVDDVLKLYSMGGTGETVVQEWGAVKKEFIRNLAVLRYADAHLGMIHFLCLEQRGFSLYNKTIAERV